MKFLIVAFALVCAVSARPQFGGFGGSASNAAAGAQSFK